jgi:predicted esterase
MNVLRDLLYSAAGISASDKPTIVTERETQLDLEIFNGPDEFAKWTCEFWRVPIKLYKLADIGLGSSFDINSDKVIEDAEDGEADSSANDNHDSLGNDTPDHKFAMDDASLVFNVYTRKHASDSENKLANSGATIFSHGIGSQFVVNRTLTDAFKNYKNDDSATSFVVVNKVNFALHRLGKLLGACGTRRFVVYEYPLFGFDNASKSSGDFSEINAILCLRHVIDFVRKDLNTRSKHINLLGYSFGTGPTLRMSRFYAVHRTAILAPYTNLYNTALQLPSSWIIQQHGSIASAEHIKHTNCPIMIIHGIEDDVIDCNHAKTLFLALPEKTRKESHLIYLPTGHYIISDFTSNTEWSEPLRQFFSGYSFKDVDYAHTLHVSDRSALSCDSEQLKYTKKVLIIVVIFVAICVVGSFFLGRQFTPQSTSEQEEKTVSGQETP